MSDGVGSVRTYLLTRPPVTALVGPRIYPRNLQQGYELPAIAIWGVTKTDEYGLSGAVDLTQYRIQIDCYGHDRQDAQNLAEAVRLAMTGYTGQMGADEVQTCHMDNQRDDTTGPRDAAGRYRHTIQQDWILFITETVSG